MENELNMSRMLSEKGEILEVVNDFRKRKICTI